MSGVQRDFDLKHLNTFGVSSIASEYAEFTSPDALRELLDTKYPLFILGGGSNLLLPEHLDQRVLKNQIAGIDILDDGISNVLVKVGGGVVWHDLVSWAVGKGLGGIENLALIPGTVGAAPIQNIGAYGVELQDVFQELTCVDLETGEEFGLNKAECEFGYRNSVFKNRLKNNTCIADIIIRLSKPGYHELRTSYASLEKELQRRDLPEITLKSIFDAVIDIRRGKLPDPSVIGNSGSFFKNSIVDEETFERLNGVYNDLVYYHNSDGTYKIPTGWLIEKVGWKGKRLGNAGVYAKQALVLVNLGGATSAEIKTLAETIQKDVYEEFGIRIVPEVNML